MNKYQTPAAVKVTRKITTNHNESALKVRKKITVNHNQTLLKA